MLSNLKSEGLTLEDSVQGRVRAAIDLFIHEAYSKNRTHGRIKTALFRQFLKSIRGSRGLTIKMAQLASFVDMGLPLEIQSIMGEIQDSAKPISFTQIQSILQNQYGEALENIFSSISPKPMAVTSLAQLHRATLKTGENVVIKVQVPDVKNLLEAQFKKLSAIVFIKNLMGSSMSEVFEQMRTYILDELDYDKEIHNQIRFRNIFEHEPRIVIPKIYSELCKKNIIVSHYEPGLSFATFCARGTHHEKSEAALLIAYFQGFAIFRRGAMSGDCHAGNFLFRENQVIFVDFGRVIEFEPEELNFERELYLDLLHQKKNSVIHKLRENNIAEHPEKFNFDDFWKLLLRQEEHHLSNVDFQINPAYVNGINQASTHFLKSNRIKVTPRLIRLFLTNATLLNLFSKLEAKGPWRAQALDVLNLSVSDPKARRAQLN